MGIVICFSLVDRGLVGFLSLIVFVEFYFVIVLNWSGFFKILFFFCFGMYIFSKELVKLFIWIYD